LLPYSTISCPLIIFFVVLFKQKLNEVKESITWTTGIYHDKVKDQHLNLCTVKESLKHHLNKQKTTLIEFSTIFSIQWDQDSSTNILHFCWILYINITIPLKFTDIVLNMRRKSSRSYCQNIEKHFEIYIIHVLLWVKFETRMVVHVFQIIIVLTSI
jgi:ssRNA-specific RNase YbeY (16S rRNA maturation enzyme)